MFYFLREDFEGLNAQIDKICEKIKEIGQEMGRSCKEGAETFHDNFAYENGERQQYMWSTRLRELIRIRNNARVVTPEGRSDKVSIGRTVTIRNETADEVQILKIGSYMVFKERSQNVISYNAPLARLLIGAEVGERREGNIGGKKKIFQIIKIE